MSGAAFFYPDCRAFTGEPASIPGKSKGKKGFSVELKPFFLSVAGAAGFEPANVASKGRCLTTWPHPSIDAVKPAEESIKRITQNKK